MCGLSGAPGSHGTRPVGGTWVSGVESGQVAGEAAHHGQAVAPSVGGRRRLAHASAACTVIVGCPDSFPGGERSRPRAPIQAPVLVAQGAPQRHVAVQISARGGHDRASCRPGPHRQGQRAAVDLGVDTGCGRVALAQHLGRPREATPLPATDWSQRYDAAHARRRSGSLAAAGCLRYQDHRVTRIGDVRSARPATARAG